MKTVSSAPNVLIKPAITPAVTANSATEYADPQAVIKACAVKVTEGSEATDER